MTGSGALPPESSGDEHEPGLGGDSDEVLTPDAPDEIVVPAAVVGPASMPDEGSEMSIVPPETDTVAEPAASPDAEGAPRKVVERAQDPGPLFWLALAVGWGIIGFGIHGMVSNWSGANPPVVLRSAIGLNVVNDALVAPALVAVAFACRRLLPRWSLLSVQVGLIVSAAVILYSYPLVGSWGKSSRAGPSLLPWNYAHNLEIVLGVVWTACAGLATWSWNRARLRS